jgi:hypothetical protein
MPNLVEEYKEECMLLQWLLIMAVIGIVFLFFNNSPK